MVGGVEDQLALFAFDLDANVAAVGTGGGGAALHLTGVGTVRLMACPLKWSVSPPARRRKFASETATEIGPLHF